ERPYRAGDPIWSRVRGLACPHPIGPRRAGAYVVGSENRRRAGGTVGVSHRLDGAALHRAAAPDRSDHHHPEPLAPRDDLADTSVLLRISRSCAALAVRGV